MAGEKKKKEEELKQLEKRKEKAKREEEVDLLEEIAELKKDIRIYEQLAQNDVKLKILDNE